MNSDEAFVYFECSSRSFDNICSLTLFAFFESFFRIAEHTKPVTRTNELKHILCNVCQHIQWLVFRMSVISNAYV